MKIISEIIPGTGLPSSYIGLPMSKATDCDIITLLMLDNKAPTITPTQFEVPINMDIYKNKVKDDLLHCPSMFTLCLNNDDIHKLNKLKIKDYGVIEKLILVINEDTLCDTKHDIESIYVCGMTVQEFNNIDIDDVLKIYKDSKLVTIDIHAVCKPSVLTSPHTPSISVDVQYRGAFKTTGPDNYILFDIIPFLKSNGETIKINIIKT